MRSNTCSLWSSRWPALRGCWRRAGAGRSSTRRRSTRCWPPACRCWSCSTQVQRVCSPPLPLCQRAAASLPSILAPFALPHRVDMRRPASRLENVLITARRRESYSLRRSCHAAAIPVDNLYYSCQLTRVGNLLFSQGSVRHIRTRPGCAGRWRRRLVRRLATTRRSEHCLSLTFHCLSLTFHCLSLTFHCLSLTFHCLSLTFHCEPPAKSRAGS